MELIVTVLIGVIFTAIGRSLLISSLNNHKNFNTKRTILESNRSLDTTLKKYLMGSKSFSQLDFQIPNTNKRSRGKGIYVDPNTDLLGNVSMGNDRLTIVIREKMSSYVRLSALPVSGSGNLTVASIDSMAVSQILQPGDLLGITNESKSHLIQLGGSISPMGSTQAALTYGPSTFAPTLDGEKAVVANYRVGDFVHKARLLQIGISPSTNKIQMTGLGPNPFDLQDLVEQLKITFHLKEGTDCAPLQTPPDVFIDQWAQLNSTGAGECYQRIDNIKLEVKRLGKMESFTFSL